jgi:hypothetical protein
MLPSRGCCHAVFLLVFSARLKQYSGLEDWVEAAKGRATIMAAALNLSTVATSMVALDLVSLNPVLPAKSLQSAGEDASNHTFEKIARILLERSPPLWLKVAVDNKTVCREYIPAADLDALAWLGDALDSILLDVFRSSIAEKDFAPKAIGDAAELIVVAALKRMGGTVTHVAQISDAFGYDIEHRLSSRTSRIEVKACSAQTSGCFILSRNEFDKSQLFKSEWRLIQVIFKVGAVFGTTIGPEDIVAVRELTPDTILKLTPEDSDSFRWRESAEYHPKTDHWTPCRLDLDLTFRAPMRAQKTKQSIGN